VPDYNPIVEDVLSGSLKDVFEDKKTKDEKPEIKSEAVKKPEHKRFSKRKAFIIFLLISLVAGGIYSIYLKNVRKDSFEYQYEQAVVMYDKKEYGKAQGYLNRAMELKTGDLNAWKLQARLAEDVGDTELMKTCYEYLLTELDPSNQEIYIKLGDIYIAEGDMDKVKTMLSECEFPSVLSYFKDYIAEVPTASFPEGLYFDVLQVELEAGENDIYFTMDGSKPTVNSTKYEGTINLTEGETTIRAISVTKAGVSSDEAIFKYEISYLIPEMPTVSPVSGSYPQKLEIVVQVPDGCTVLYTLNGSVPTLDSAVYTGPVNITKNVIFTAVSVSMSGHMSDTVTRNYIITP
jgi:tetratricopeptide (TPR) repeat protein